MLAESVTHTHSLSYISMSVFVQLHTSLIWLHLTVLIHAFGDKGNTGAGQISPAEAAASLEKGLLELGYKTNKADKQATFGGDSVPCTPEIKNTL